MKLITEQIEDVKYITEKREDGKKNFYIEGIFMQGGIKNRNGRMYPVDTLVAETNRYAQELVAKGRAYGELGHPNGPSINLDRVSHRIVELKQVDSTGNIYGKALVMDEGMGKIARGIIDMGGTLGVSSRGMGSIKEGKDGIMEVQKDFYLATAADIVADPSAPDAFVQGIMEGVEWVWDNGILKAQKLEEAKRQIDAASASKSLSEEKKLEIFEKMLGRMASM
jgi:hypothetical protein